MTMRDAGGIYLHTLDLAASEVARVVEAYWTARAAFKVERDPYLVPAFDAGRTGVLSISLARVSPAWILVRDSERYTCDWELARALHETLGVEVLAYTASESVARAHVMRWHAGELSHEREPARVEALLAELPGAFEVLPDTRPLEEPEGVDFLIFDGIGVPTGLPSSYAGPELDSEMGRSLLERKARSLIAKQSLELPNFLDEYPFLCSLLYGLCARLPLHEVDAQRLVLALERLLISHEVGLQQLAYAAHRAGRHELVTRAEGGLSQDKRLAGRRDWFYLLTCEGAWEQALAAFVELEARETPADYELNNLCHVLAHLEPDALPPATMARYLARAQERAKHNPHIFHNLACVLLRRGDVDGALDCVEGAIDHHYPMLDLLRKDSDLASLCETSRWQMAWARYDAGRRRVHVDDDEHEEAPAPPKRKIIVPGVGIDLEGVGMLSIDIELDDLINLVGRVSNDFDAAHGVYRFEQVGLVYTHHDGIELVSRVAASPPTIVAGVDLWPVSAREAVAQVWEALGEEPWYIRRDGGGGYYVFRSTNLVFNHFPGVSGARLTSVVVQRTLRQYMAKDLENSLRVSEAERAIREAQREQREQALCSYFARLNRQLDLG